MSATLALAGALAATAAGAGDIAVMHAWVPPADKVGSDVPLGMKVANEGADADALVRAACPFANFSEKRTVDHGEGAPSKRSIPNIPIPARASVTLAETAFHVALLQTREPLTEGASFACSVTFRKAGPMEVTVRVARAAPGS